MTSSIIATKTPGMYYGWKIVGVTFVTQFISIGFVFYSYGVFFKAVAAEFGATRFGVGAGLAFIQICTGLVSPLLGRALDRGHVRNIMLAGSILMAVGFACASRVSSMFQFYAVLGLLLGLGQAMLGPVPSSTLVANWFVRRRGMALGIATMGISLSGMVMAPVSTRLIERLGVRQAFLIYGVLAVVLVMPVVWRYVISRPEAMGLLPDGDGGALGGSGQPPAETASPPQTHEKIGDRPPARHVSTDEAARRAAFSPRPVAWSSARLLHEPNFWVLSIVVGINMCCNGATLTHIIPHATDLGFEPMSAALILSAMAGFGVIGKVFFGWFTDAGDRRVAFWLCMGLQAVGVTLVLGVTEYRLLLAAGAVYGFGMGGMVPIWGAMVGAVFGRLSFGRVMGLMAPCMLPLQMLGVPLAGKIYDVQGSYDAAFKLFIAMYLIAMVILIRLRIPEAEPDA